MTMSTPAMPIRSSVAEITQAVSIYINQIVYDLKRRGKDVIALSLGEAFFEIPLFDFNKLDLAKGYHYSDSQGLPELRHKLADYYKRLYDTDVDADKELLISAGSKPIIYMSMVATMEPGKKVMIHEPAWLSYPEQAKLAGLKAGFIPFDVRGAGFADYIDDETGMVVINNPNNPAGRMYEREELLKIYQICRERGAYLLVDEAYSDFVIDNEFYSMARLVEDKDGVIVVNSLSKNMGISGWRIGYAIASETFIEQLLKVNQHLITCAPTVLLQYCAKYFDQILDSTLPQARDVVRKRARIADYMDEIGLDRLPGGETFYFFVSIGDYPGTSLEFALKLLVEKSIAVVPGSAYGESTDRFIRLSIGTESEERIWEALLEIKELIRSKSVEREKTAAKLQELGFDWLES